MWLEICLYLSYGDKSAIFSSSSTLSSDGKRNSQIYLIIIFMFQVHIYVDMFKGYTPIESLILNATITSPYGQESVLMLHDDGAGI